MAGFLYPEDGSTPQVRKVRPKGVLGWLLRLTPITIEEVVPGSSGGAAIHPPDPDRSIDIDQGWHGLHFLFTGTADEGDEPACYSRGVARTSTTRATHGRYDPIRFAASRRISIRSHLTIARRYDPARMTSSKSIPM